MNRRQFLAVLPAFPGALATVPGSDPILEDVLKMIRILERDKRENPWIIGVLRRGEVTYQINYR